MKDRRQKADMRTRASVFAASLVLTGCALASPAATPVTSSVDAGGGRSGAGDTVNDGCIGGCVGVSVIGSSVFRHGFAGQLAEPAGLALSGAPSALNEGAASQLSGVATLDDGSFTALSGSDIVWGLHIYPLASIAPDGLATASLVYSNTAAAISGSYLGVPGAGALRVLDTQPDNYGSYAGDGVPDWWQSLYFGLDSAEALAHLDPDGDEQNNLHEWMALTEPTNSASQFLLRIERVASQPDQKLLVFSPRREARAYTPLYRTDLAGGDPWAPLTTVQTYDDGTERFLTDTNATRAAKFYRIQIAIP